MGIFHKSLLTCQKMHHLFGFSIDSPPPPKKIVICYITLIKTRDLSRYKNVLEMEVIAFSE